MRVTIRPLRDDELADWLPRVQTEYAHAMVEHGGMPNDVAEVRAVADVGRAFPGGRSGPGQFVFAVEAGGERVGERWVGERADELLRGALWVFDVRIDEAHRGRGYGREAMLRAEDEARRLGFDRVVLNMFGANERARSLYRSLGYAESAVTMTKRV